MTERKDAQKAQAKSKRQQIIEMGKEGVPVAEIAKRLGVRYQFVRNVLIEKGIERVKVRNTERNISNELRKLMYEEGLSPYKAAMKLGVPPQYAYNVRNRDRKKGQK